MDGLKYGVLERSSRLWSRRRFPITGVFGKDLFKEKKTVSQKSQILECSKIRFSDHSFLLRSLKVFWLFWPYAIWNIGVGGSQKNAWASVDVIEKTHAGMVNRKCILEGGFGWWWRWRIAKNIKKSDYHDDFSKLHPYTLSCDYWDFVKVSADHGVELIISILNSDVYGSEQGQCCRHIWYTSCDSHTVLQTNGWMEFVKGDV